MSEHSTTAPAVVMAGVPEINAALYRRLRFSVGDPAALIQLPGNGKPGQSILILRDIEIERARKHARADHVASANDYAPEEGLSGDRETATAQAAAECLRRAGVQRVIGDRSLPLIFAEMIRRAGISVECDMEMGVLERRAKDEQEIAWLRNSQRITENVMRRACELIARARAGADGTLIVDGEPLTSERVRTAIDHWLLDDGFVAPPSIVAGGPMAADCHHIGAGPLRTSQPVILDIFPRDRQTHYYGDCSRTVVPGDIPTEITDMHAAVLQAKAAAIAAVRPGVTGESVHKAASEVITRHGYHMGLPKDDAPQSYCAMTHGTGHGIGLEVHEPPLLDVGGPPLVLSDALTIEPGLYRRDLGGVRVEDMVIVTPEGCENLNSLHEGLDWR